MIETIKLILKEPKFYVDNYRIICKLEGVILNSDTKEVYKKLSYSGISYCNPEDEFDPKFGRDLAMSRAKQGVYNCAVDFSCQYPDSIKWTFFKCKTYLYACKEINHERYLLGKPETNITSDLRTFTLANLEGQLPLLRNELAGVSHFPKKFRI